MIARWPSNGPMDHHFYHKPARFHKIPEHEAQSIMWRATMPGSSYEIHGAHGPNEAPVAPRLAPKTRFPEFIPLL